MKSKRALIIIVGAILAFGGTCWVLYSRSLLRPAASIRTSLLRQTPLGSTSEEVRAFLERRGWLDRRYVGWHGFRKREAGIKPVTVGVTSLCGHLGRYHFPLRRVPAETDVTAFWGFDANGRLIDVWVWKTVESL